MFYEQRLCNRNFLLACLCNLAFCLSFHMLIPVLPLYFTTELGVSRSLTGAAVSIFSLAALLTRPFAGFLVDSLQRKPLFILCLLPFIAFTSGYYFLTSVILLTVLRFGHGASFSASQTLLSTIAVDHIPLNKMGTGIGLFGVIVSVSMALGPMIGLEVTRLFSFDTTFIVSTVVAFASFTIGMTIHMRKKDIQPQLAKKGFTPADFIFRPGLWLALCLTLPTATFGLLTNYISLFALEKGLAGATGTFFLVFAAGMVTSRLVSSPLLDKGLFLLVTVLGKCIIATAVLLYIYATSPLALYGSASLAGIGYGLIFPAYQTKMLQLAPDEQKGMANSTYFLACDVGIGLAIFLGGMIADLTSLTFMYWIGAVFIAISTLMLLYFSLRKPQAA